MFALLFVLLAALLPRPALAGPTAQAGPYRLELVTAPATIGVGRALLVVTVRDADGRPVEGATLTALTRMPGMAMGEREERGRPRAGQPGVYQIPAQFPMEGRYESAIRVVGPRGAATATVPLATGQDTAQSGTSEAGWALGLAAALALAAFVLYRLRATGQKLTLRPLWNAQTAGSLLLLGALLAGAVYAVGHFRRPGAMTPIEAQASDMSDMPPPSSAAPVELATVTRGPVAATVRYAGSVVGFTEQEIAARGAGVLQRIPVYAGDRVSAGQLLARLDTRQSAPQTAEATAAADTAGKEVAVARAERAQAQQEVGLAHAERAGRLGALEEAQAMDAAAEREIDTAAAAIDAAQAQAAQAQAERKAAQADQSFWSAQRERSRRLKEAGALSGEEFQRDLAQADAADARAEQAEARQAEARARAADARNAHQKALAQRQAAQAKVRMAQSEVDAHSAHLLVSRAAVETAARKLEKARSGARQADAALRSARTQESFAQVRAESDGVVLQRLVSPGTLVQPGQVLLRIAQIRPIRLQATVAQADLARIRVGARVRVQATDGRTVAARLTSISPALDPATRTGTVEALFPNLDQRFLPGQYVAFEIEIGSGERGLQVPAEAVRYGPGTTPFVWVAEAAGAGQRIARRTPIATGEANRDRVVVRAGLREGEQVVVRGGTFLNDGDPLTAAPEDETQPHRAADGAVVAAVTVSERGFEPARLGVQVGVPARLTFTRIDEKNCGTEILVPEYGIRQALPLNRPVTIEFTPKRAGTIRFACGMNMLRGEATAR